MRKNGPDIGRLGASSAVRMRILLERTTNKINLFLDHNGRGVQNGPLSLIILIKTSLMLLFVALEKRG